jgi:hypothetical protein
MSEHEHGPVPPVEYFLHLGDDDPITFELQHQLVEFPSALVVAGEVVEPREDGEDEHMHCVIASRPFDAGLDEEEHLARLVASLRALANIVEGRRFTRAAVEVDDDTERFIVDVVKGLP